MISYLWRTIERTFWDPSMIKKSFKGKKLQLLPSETYDGPTPKFPAHSTIGRSSRFETSDFASRAKSRVLPSMSSEYGIMFL